MWANIIKLITLFSQLPETVQVLMILAVLWGIKTGVISIVRNKMGISFSFFGTQKPLEHSACRNYESFKLELGKERSKGERVMSVKYIDTVYDQMSLVRTTASEVNDKLSDRYAELLAKQELTEQQRVDALEIYQMILDGALDDACGFLRKWIKRNHLSDMDDVQYQEYIVKRTNEAQKLIKKYIDRKYLKSQLVLDRKDLYDHNMELFHTEIKEKLAGMFIQIRHIAEESGKKIDLIMQE